MTQEQILFFEESYTKYYRMMVQTVLPIVGSRDIAEDIVADNGQNGLHHHPVILCI